MDYTQSIDALQKVADNILLVLDLGANELNPMQIQYLDTALEKCMIVKSNLLISKALQDSSA